MFCDKCGSTLNANGQCPVCDAPISFDQPTAISDPGKGLGLAGMIVGIASIFSGLAVGIVGLILSNMAKTKSEAAGFVNTFAKVGRITSTIGIASNAIIIGLLVLYYVAIIAFALLSSY